MAMVDAHRGVRRRPSAMKTKCSVAQGKCCADTRSKCNPGQTKGLARIQCNRDYSYTRAASWSVVLNDCRIGNCGPAGGANDSRSALQCNTLCNIQTRSPAKSSGGERDRIAVQRRVVQSLHIRHRPVGMIDRGPAARDGKATQNQSKQKGSDRFCHLRSYQNQLPWQVIYLLLLFNFLCSGRLFWQAPFDKPIQNLSHACPRVRAIGKLVNLAVTRLQISI